MPLKPPTIRDVLSPHAVPMHELDTRYHSLLALVRAMIGVAPNCDALLEMFPPAFTSYNLLVPNLLNAPFLLWGVAAPADLVSLALYYSARSAQCAYCSLHTCSFAVRRGVDEDVLTGQRQLSVREGVVVELALNMSSFPNHITEHDRERIYDVLSPADVEWIVLTISIAGYLTTVMNSMGIDMEQTTVDEVAALLRKAGWSEGKHDVTPPTHELQHASAKPVRSDSLWSNMSMLRYIPSALHYDNKATRRIPKAWPAIGDFLTQAIGHSFPILGLLTHSRAARAIAEVLRLNLDAIVCGIEPDVKYVIGMVFAGVNENTLLLKEFHNMTMLMVDYLSEDDLQCVHDFATEYTEFSPQGGVQELIGKSRLRGVKGLSSRAVRMLVLAKACCYMPTKTTEVVVELTKSLRPAAVVELINWVGVLSLLHKLYMFFYPSCLEHGITLKKAQLRERAPQFTKILPRID